MRFRLPDMVTEHYFKIINYCHRATITTTAVTTNEYKPTSTLSSPVMPKGRELSDEKSAVIVDRVWSSAPILKICVFAVCGAALFVIP